MRENDSGSSGPKIVVIDGISSGEALEVLGKWIAGEGSFVPGTEKFVRDIAGLEERKEKRKTVL